MKANLFSISIFAVLVLSALTVSAQEIPKELILENGVAPHKGLDSVYQRFSEGYRKLDAAQVAGLYTETVAYLAPGDDVKTGRQKVAEIFNRFFDSVKKRNGKLAISFRVLQRKVDRNLAYDVGIYTLVSTNDNGESRQDSGKYVVVAVREKGDVWRFQVDGYSDLPKQP